MLSHAKTLALCAFILFTTGNSKVLLAAEVYDNLTLKQAIEIALSNNFEKKISYQAAAIAESQYQEPSIANFHRASLSCNATSACLRSVISESTTNKNRIPALSEEINSRRNSASNEE